MKTTRFIKKYLNEKYISRIYQKPLDISEAYIDKGWIRLLRDYAMGTA